MATVAILPWLRLEHEILLNEFRLLPIDLHTYQFDTPDEGAIVHRVMSSHYVAEKASLDRATLAVKVGQSLIADLTDSEQTLLYEYIELVACSGLSAREFFSFSSYCNRDSFRLAIFQLSGSDQGVNYPTRRRDGSVNHMTSVPRFLKPDHVQSNAIIKVDEALLTALLATQSQTPVQPWWAQVSEAILSFNLANTDSQSVPQHMELISLASAFQRLLDDWRCDGLRSVFEQLVVPGTPISKSAATCTRLAAPTMQTEIKDPKYGDWIRSGWIRDLCALRNKLAHGEIEPSRTPFWSLRNHLLLASYAFPLTLKAFLTQNGAYTLTDDDTFDIDVFELLACEEHFNVLGDDEPHPWNTVRGNAKRKLLASQIANMLTPLSASAPNAQQANP